MIILFVIIGLSVLILVHEAGHFFMSKIFGVKVEEFGFGFPPRLFGKKKGETVYSLNALPLGGFVKIYGEDESTVSHEPERSFAHQKIWKRSVILLAGIFMNIILAWLFFSVALMIGAPHHLALTDVADNSPAAMSGLKQGDIIAKIQYGTDILTDPISSDSFTSFTKKYVGEKLDLTVKRGNSFFDTTLIPRKNPPPCEGAMGVGIGDIAIEKTSFFASFPTGAEETYYSTQAIIGGFGDLFTAPFQKTCAAGAALKSVSGPLGIFNFASEAGALGFVYLIQLIGAISLNLAVLNFLPIPALDGGRFLFLIIEKIKGTPIPIKFQRTANAVGFAFLILLMIIVTVHDIGKIF